MCDNAEKYQLTERHFEEWQMENAIYKINPFAFFSVGYGYSIHTVSALCFGLLTDQWISGPCAILPIR